MHPTTYKIILTTAEFIAPGVKHFSFRRADNSALTFIPGQFITLHLEQGGKLVRRSYSIASIVGVDNTIDFAASYISGGLASEFLFELQSGHILEASGPFGRLILKEEQPQRLILVATGTGVTPYRAMLPELEKRAQQGMQIVIMQGVQRREGLLYSADFLASAARYPQNIQFQAFYSREFPQDAQLFEHSGHVQTGFARLNLAPEKDIFYLCGNPNMIDEAFELLKNQGFDSQQIRREKYISSK